jgi:hypothetical protein
MPPRDDSLAMMIKRPPLDELAELCERINLRYRDRFSAFGGGFNSWANRAHIAGEAAFGGRIGPMEGAIVRYARRTGWYGLFGPLVPFKTIGDAEIELCQELDVVLEKLAKGWRPRMFGRRA